MHLALGASSPRQKIRLRYVWFFSFSQTRVLGGEAVFPFTPTLMYPSHTCLAPLAVATCQAAAAWQGCANQFVTFPPFYMGGLNFCSMPLFGTKTKITRFFIYKQQNLGSNDVTDTVNFDQQDFNGMRKSTFLKINLGHFYSSFLPKILYLSQFLYALSNGDIYFQRRVPL